MLGNSPQSRERQEEGGKDARPSKRQRANPTPNAPSPITETMHDTPQNQQYQYPPPQRHPQQHYRDSGHIGGGENPFPSREPLVPSLKSAQWDQQSTLPKLLPLPSHGSAPSAPSASPTNPITKPLGEKEKGRKLSCRECRRLKLKCDRNFPCQSCVKRGCGSLCPEGALTSGRGSRFILANTEQLHDKILQLSDRVRQLEDALEVLQSSCSNQPHPLLAPELLRIKTSQDLYGASPQPMAPDRPLGPKDEPLRESVATLSISQTPEHCYVTKSEGQESTASDPDLQRNREPTPPRVPPDILQLSATFPFPWVVDLKIRQRIRDALPPRKEAHQICQEARRNALWQYNFDPSETFIENLLHHCYTVPIEELSPRRLALLLMVLSIGSLVDLNQPLGSVNGEAYHHLARAAVCEIPLMEEPDFDVLHALFFMVWYHLIFSDNKKAIGYAWNLVGFVAKLAQGLGLHRDNSRLKMIPEEYEKRKAMLWELLNLDCRMSLSLGRPPSICLTHVDIKPPDYTSAGLYVPKEEAIYHEWKNSFFIHCLSPILEAIVTVHPPDYERIIELDKTVRDYETPRILEGPTADGVSPRFLVMQRGLVAMSRAIALLQLHRRHFTEAMNGPEPFTLHHQHAPSVLATYLGTSSLIGAVEELYEQEQQLSVRFLHFWFNAFSAAVTLALFISRAPSTSLAPHALKDLERVCRLFRRAAAILPFSSKSLLPSAFTSVHPHLANYAEQQQDQPNSTAASETWLPEIYEFNCAGVGIEERYVSQASPFTPSSPRVAENANFNFDHVESVLNCYTVSITLIVSSSVCLMARIREVWSTNLEAEIRNIREVIDKYPYIAMVIPSHRASQVDTEFPGVVARPIGTFKASSDYHYQTMRCNVDLLKIIQVGITLADDNGSYPQEESIEYLQKSGIDFQKHEEYGIAPNDFAELMITSGMVLAPETKWISFHSGYDFGYFLKLLTAESLPTTEDEFFDLLKIWFPTVYDIKFLMRASKNLKGGLQEVADDLGVMRIGPSHQAGSDSLLTASTFFKIRELYFNDRIDDAEYSGKLYGLGQTFVPTNGLDPSRGGATLAERDDRGPPRELHNQTPGTNSASQSQGIPLGLGSIPGSMPTPLPYPPLANGHYLRNPLVTGTR
ncbi:hypothetical protein AX16_005468 [Volvariella volvacea WC 439]|nr:hypothetical protein AX16_005468 [Volvariella volvacea WC 439]